MGREKNRHTSSPSSFSSQERRPKKIPRSCLACHQRKVRCSMELPACFACRKHARTLGEDPANTRCSYYDQRSGRLESPPQASESRKEGKRKSVKLDETVMDEVVEDGFIAGMGTGRDSRRLAREGGTEVASHSYDVAPTLPPTPTSPLISDFPGVDVPSASSPRSPHPSPPLKLRNFPTVFNTSLPSLPPSKVVTPLDDAFAAVSPAPVIQEYDSLDDFSFSSSSAYENGISPGVFGNGISPGVFAKEGQVPLWAM